MDLGAPLPLEIDRQQIRPCCQQHPQDPAAILRVAHLRGNHREHAAEVPESPSASRLPSAASASSTTTTTGPMARSTDRTRSRLPSVSPTYFERKFLRMTHGTPIS